MSGFAKIYCRVPGGVILKTFEKSKGPFGVISSLPKDAVILTEGLNDIDRKFYASWIKANPGHDLIRNRLIERIN